MIEIFKPNNIIKSTALLGAFVLPACATTEGPGVLARRDQCIPTEISYTLDTGQDIDIAVSDISFKNAGIINDNIHANVQGPGIIKFEFGNVENTVINIDGNYINDEISITALNDPIKGQMKEDDKVLDFTVSKDGESTILDLNWSCNKN